MYDVSVYAYYQYAGCENGPWKITASDHKLAHFWQNEQIFNRSIQIFFNRLVANVKWPYMVSFENWIKIFEILLQNFQALCCRIHGKIALT